MRRVLSTFTVVSGAALLALSAAGAASLRGTEGPDRLIGTDRADSIHGRGGNDVIVARGDADTIQAGTGRDIVHGGDGDDRIAVHSDDAADLVGCGAGRDVVVAEHRDRVDADCEVVSRQLSRDLHPDPAAQHQTQVEPDSFSVGTTIVTAFQSGRYFAGAASNIGWATTHDAGRTWRRGFLPALTSASTPPGSFERASDPVVAYDAAHGLWLISTLTVSERTGLATSRSTDGVSWSPPVVAAADPAEDYDKQWLVCDNWPASPFRGTCYLSYYDGASERIATRTTHDGALTWSAPAYSPDPVQPRTSVNGAQPVVQPDGTLVVVHAVFPRGSPVQLVAIRSTDGGTTFSPAVPISAVGTKSHALRAPPLPAADVDATGTIYAVWQDCRLRPDCTGTDVHLATSADGVTWTSPRRVAAAPAGVDLVIPTIAADPATGGASASLALLYVRVSETVDVVISTSADSGRTWSAAETLNAEPMRLRWLPRTRLGRMLADYNSVSFVAGRPIPVFALASEPDEAEFEEVIVATTRRV